MNTTVEQKAKELGINVTCLIASREKPIYEMGRLQYDKERHDGSFSGCGAMRQWHPDTKYYIWDALNEYVTSVGTWRTVTYFNPTNSICAGSYAKTLTHVSIPNKIRECLVYYEMFNDTVSQKVEFPVEDISLKLEDIHYYLEPDVNPSGFKNLINKKVYPIKVSDKIVFEEEKIATFSAIYTTGNPYADTIEEGFALCGWKPYKYFDSDFEIYKTRFWDGHTYWCGYSIRGHRVRRSYEDMSFLKEISSENREVNSLEKSWWHSSPMMLEGRLTEIEAQEKYFKLLNERKYIETSVEDIIKDFYDRDGNVRIKDLRKN